MMLPARAVALCAAMLAVAAAYTVDCNHEYTDCDKELSKLSEDEELPSLKGSGSIVIDDATPTKLPPSEPSISSIKTTQKITEMITETPTERSEKSEEVKPQPRLLNLNVDELQNFANVLHNQTDKASKKLPDLSDVTIDDDDEDPPRTNENIHNKDISDKFFSNLQAPFDGLMTGKSESSEVDICKENDIGYKIGDKIERGCEETCECTAGGIFECSARCKHPYIRRGRRLNDPLCFESPVDDCCSIIACATGNGDAKISKLEVCKHNNETYPVGTRWFDGCESSCVCEANAVVSCKPRCKSLIQSESCINVPDPNDSCCEVQVCDVSQDGHELAENVTSTTSTTASTGHKMSVTEEEEERGNFKRPLVLAEPIGSIKVLQNNSVQVNLMHPNDSTDPIHLLLSEDGGKNFHDVELKYSNLILNLKGGKDYILKTKETGTKFNFTVTAAGPVEVNEVEEHDNISKAGCWEDGKFYEVGEEFKIGCTELCECTGPESRECVALVCPNHVGLEIMSKGCVKWAPSPPAQPPNCCPRSARCLSDGTCHYNGVPVPNWSEVPISLTGCEQRCFCENGDLDCQEVCSPLPSLPPQTLRCPPLHRPAPVNISDEDCCKQWGCIPNGPNGSQYFNMPAIGEGTNYVTPIPPTFPPESKEVLSEPPEATDTVINFYKHINPFKFQLKSDSTPLFTPILQYTSEIEKDHLDDNGSILSMSDIGKHKSTQTEDDNKVTESNNWTHLIDPLTLSMPGKITNTQSNKKPIIFTAKTTVSIDQTKSDKNNITAFTVADTGLQFKTTQTEPSVLKYNDYWLYHPSSKNQESSKSYPKIHTTQAHPSIDHRESYKPGENITVFSVSDLNSPFKTIQLQPPKVKSTDYLPHHSPKNLHDTVNIEKNHTSFSQVAQSYPDRRVNFVMTDEKVRDILHLHHAVQDQFSDLYQTKETFDTPQVMRKLPISTTSESFRYFVPHQKKTHSPLSPSSINYHSKVIDDTFALPTSNYFFEPIIANRSDYILTKSESASPRSNIIPKEHTLQNPFGKHVTVLKTKVLKPSKSIDPYNVFWSQNAKTSVLTKNPYETIKLKAVDSLKPSKTSMVTQNINSLQGSSKMYSAIDLEDLLNQMEVQSEVNRNLGRSADKNQGLAAGQHPPIPADFPPHKPLPPSFLPTIPPETHYPHEDDFDQNNIHHPPSEQPGLPGLPGLQPGLPGLPPGLVPTSFGDMNKKLSVISIESDSTTSIKMLLGLPPVLVGLRGSVDLRYTDKADEDVTHWYSQVFAPADEVLTTPRLEFRLTGLKPSTTYKVRGKLYLHNLPVSPESDTYSVRTQDLPMIGPVEEKRREINSGLTVVNVNDTTAHVSWRHFDEDELQFIDGIQVRYRPVGTPIYSMTELLHHSRSAAELHDLRPGSTYEASLVLIPPPRATTELHDPGKIKFTTAPYIDPYNWTVVIEVRSVGAEAAELTWRGVPSPAERWVRVYRAAHACGDAAGKEQDEFRLAARDQPPAVTLTGLVPDSRCRVWLELFLTNGKVKTSNVLEINTKLLDTDNPIDNEIEASGHSVARGRPRGDYYTALVGVGVVAALGALTSLLLLLVVVRRHRPRSVPITPVPTAPRESSLPPYDNPAYKLELQQETMDL